MGSVGAAKMSAGGNAPIAENPLAKYSVPEQLDALYAKDIKVGDSIEYKLLDTISDKFKGVTWTFHPEGLTFKEIPYSDIKITNVKVTAKTVRVTGLYDKAVTKINPTAEDYGKDMIRVTKTFKLDDIVRRRL